MSNTLYSSLCLMLLCVGWHPLLVDAQPKSNQSSTATESIDFFVGSWSQTLEVSKIMKKPIFVFLYTTYTPECKRMTQTTFSDPEVMSFYEDNFINAKINLHSVDGMFFKNKYNLRVYPTLLYFSMNGELLFKEEGYKSTDDGMVLAENALKRTVNSSVSTGVPSIYTNFLDQKIQYQNGSDSPEFLYKYAYELKKFSEPYQSVVNRYLHSPSFANTTSMKNMRFVLDFADDIQAEAFLLLLDNQSLYSSTFGKEVVQNRIKETLRSAVVTAAIGGDLPVRDRAVQLATKANLSNANEFSTVLKALYAENTHNWESYTQTIQTYFMGEKTPNLDLLNEAARKMTLHASNKAHLETALVWIEKSVENNETRFEYSETYALVLYKLGKQQRALKEAEAAIVKARKSGGDYSTMLKLMELIRANTSR